MPYSQQDFDDAYDALIECALWSSLAWGPTPDDEPISADELHSEWDIDDAIRQELRSDVRAFMEDEEADLGDMLPQQIGHDFWLTREHHGAGFWDRGLGERGDRLTKAAQCYGSIDLGLYWRYDDNGEQVTA